MKLLIILLTAVCLLAAETPNDWALDWAWFSMTDEQRYNAPVEYKARACGLSVDEFILISSVVEAESNRGESIDGRVLIAETILNRVNSEVFPDNIHDVCYQAGQFSVISSGAAFSVGRTDLSDWAVITALREIADGSVPNVLYFNCVGYGYGTPYGYVDGNYFTVG